MSAETTTGLEKLLTEELPNSPAPSEEEEKDIEAISMFLRAKRLVGLADPESTGRTSNREILEKMAEAFREAGGKSNGESAAADVLFKAEGVRQAQPLAEVDQKLPGTILKVAGESGALLAEGTVAVLTGEGGTGKSSFAVSIAYDIAALRDGKEGPVAGTLFDGTGGRVLMVTFEDDPGVTSWRAHGYYKCVIERSRPGVLADIHVLDMAARPLFGPVPSDDGVSRYAARPGPLAGWWDMVVAARRIKPRLIVVDPVLSAYVGESNAAAPVREFLNELAKLASDIGAGVLLIAHSSKVARNPKESLRHPGLVGGSTAWVDGTRGVLALQFGEKATKNRILQVVKSNYGPSHIKATAEPVRLDRGNAIFGFTGKVESWKPLSETDNENDKPAFAN